MNEIYQVKKNLNKYTLVDLRSLLNMILEELLRRNNN